MKCVVGDYFVLFIGGGVVARWMRDHAIIWAMMMDSIVIEKGGRRCYCRYRRLRRGRCRACGIGMVVEVEGGNG
eukprot:scaffold118243_cov59-Cyclotella_meneghiniana.AAC.4